jgi:hypothetical protein
MVHGSGGPSTKVDLVLAIGLGALRRGTESGMAEDVRLGTPGESPLPPRLIFGQNSPLVLWAQGPLFRTLYVPKRIGAILLADPGTHAHTKRQRWE